MEVINQNKIRKKFVKSGVNMVGPETVFFSKDKVIFTNFGLQIPLFLIGFNQIILIKKNPVK